MKIELLATHLLDHSGLVEDFKTLSRQLNKSLGWHYLLDLVWCAKQLDVKAGNSILDAGAGWGLMQFWLAQQGVEVISVDRIVRKKFPPNMDQSFQIEGYRKTEFLPKIKDFLPPKSPKLWANYPRKLQTTFGMLRKTLGIGPKNNNRHQIQGTIRIYNQDLGDLRDLETNSVDGVISISSLEHNHPENLELSLQELKRVIKPGGKLVATLCASKDRDWFHEPSHGWCYSEASILKHFNPTRARYSSNYSEYDEIFESIVHCEALSRNLAPFYFESGENGMPWGIWDPQYIPVGIVREY